MTVKSVLLNTCTEDKKPKYMVSLEIDVEDLIDKRSNKMTKEEFDQYIGASLMESLSHYLSEKGWTF